MTATLSASAERAAHNLRVWGFGVPVLATLNRLSIPVMVVRSLPQIEELYGGAGGRETNDIDLLVPGDRAAEAIDAILALGWALHAPDDYRIIAARWGAVDVARRKPWHFLHPSRGWDSNVDLHPDSADAWSQPTMDPGCWERARPAGRDGVTFLLPSREDRLLHLSWHYFKHAVYEGVIRQDLTDLQLALEQIGEFDWDYLARRAKQTGTSIFLWLASDLVDRQRPEPALRLWRAQVAAASPWRYRLISSVLERFGGQLPSRLMVLVWWLGHDRPIALLPYWRKALFPNRMEIAGRVGHWPGPREYSLALLRFYRDLLNKVIRRP